MNEPIISNSTKRCGTCKNCQIIVRTQRSCLRALRQPGNGEEVRVVWNDMLRDFPCTALTPTPSP
jgi:hypothetical protein